MNFEGPRCRPCEQECALVPDNRVIVAIVDERGEVEERLSIPSAGRANIGMVGERVQPRRIERPCNRWGRVQGHGGNVTAPL
jgi:hypothetical protein